ncbi:hypothetical protein WMF37_47265 [Sorangium sp. So ce291]|uniref:hypothetical protein n=1 Tax=Sorangium sp. So ce291 TaxID=3133294 RepID=UPI003F5F9189
MILKVSMIVAYAATGSSVDVDSDITRTRERSSLAAFRVEYPSSNRAPGAAAPTTESEAGGRILRGYGSA